MKHLHLTLGYLKEQRAKLDASISVLETLLGSSGNGHKGTLRHVEDALALHEARPVGRPRTGTSLKARRAAKAEAVVAILREAGPGGLSIPELSEAAKARGIHSLTGINSWVIKGILKRTGKKRGQYRYSVAREA